MKAQIKKIAALFLSLCVALSMMTVASFAAETTATLTFDSDKANRTSYSTSAQVWEQNGIIFTNNKAASSTNVADYGAPVRLYANSEIIIEYPNMSITKIEFTASSATYATALKNSIGDEVSVNSNVVTVVPTSTSSTYTIAKLSAQVRLNSLTVTGTEAITDCDHTNTTTTTTDATKTENGSIVKTCDGCGKTVETTVIPALGCTVTYKVPEGEISGVEKVLKVKLPEPAPLSSNYTKEYTFVGWTKAAVETDTEVVPTLYDAGKEVTLDGDTTFYAVYSYSEKSEGGNVPAGESFVLTDISDIKAADAVIITMTCTDGTVYALTSGNGTSKAPVATTITVTNDAIDGEVADALQWNVEENAEGYAFYPNGVTDKWLYCTNTNNGVRVGTNENKLFIIDADSGYLKHTATERFVGVYLDNPDWRCYTNTTGNIKDQTLGFYVKPAAEAVTTYYTTSLDKVIKGASIDAGADLTVNFYVADEYANGTMTFTMDGETTTVSQTNGSFAFTGIAPDYMTEEIKAELTVDGTVVGTFTTTVKEIAEKYLGGDDDKVITFVKNMLHYGAASQNYQGYNTDKLANDGITGNTTEVPVKVEGIGLGASDTKYFRSASVWFANQNHIIVNFQNLPENAKLKVNGADAKFDGASYKTAGLKATELDDIYTFVVCDAEGNELQSLSYSINHYTYVMKDHENVNMSELACALYNYGVSAEAVINTAA